LLLFRDYCTGEDAFDGGAQFLLQFGLGQGFAGHHLVALGCVVDEDGFDGGNLLQVGGLQAFDDNLVGMMGARLVVEYVLNELEAGNADCSVVCGWGSIMRGAEFALNL